ncbi:COR domain-containing protein [Massilia sp. W12]|uniref:COR domain-containing protein n=1 Tax=Massilia sp. W12 TaxID=3126507 RepID=UPI0030D5AD45
MMVWRRRSLDAAAYATAADYADYAAYAADAADYAAYAAAAADAAAAAAYAADAAAAAAYAAAADSAADYIIHATQADIKKISAAPENITAFLEQPLWPDRIPNFIQTLLPEFKKAALALDPGFQFWLDFYQERLLGKPSDFKLLLEAATIPDSLYQQGAAAVNAYLMRIRNKSASAPLNLVRAIFIGHGEAGKTSLIRVLHDLPVQAREEQTPGVDIHEWSVPGTQIKAHLWDFGGQVMAHATHQLFLRESCLYVLVISARSEINATEQAEYWLEHVKSFGGNANIIIVGNRAEEVDLNIDMGMLKQKYPNIVRYFPLSCRHAKDSHASHYQAFHQEFCQQLRQLGTHQILFTAEQFAVMQNLREQTPKTSFLSKAAFEALCEQYHITRDINAGRAWLLDILDKLGVIIHFKTLPFADGYVLNPRWLTWGVYTVMYAKRAQITAHEVIDILSQNKVIDLHGNLLSYTASHCHLIISAMQEFKLCYALANKANTYIIPALLTVEQPAIATYQSEALMFELFFPVFLPRHILPELIVTRHAEIMSEQGKQLVWQYGVVLQAANRNARALLLVDYRSRRLQFWLSGHDARDYLNILRDTLATILGRLSAVDYKEFLLLPTRALLRPASTRADIMETVDTARASYAQVLAHAEAGQDEFIAESGAVYDVNQVLQLFVSLERRAADQRARRYGRNAAALIAEENEMPPPPIPASSKDTTIFLASSAEMREERDALDLFLRQMNDDLREQGRYLKIIRWEYFLDAMSATRKQDDYNAALKQCDIVLALFATKTGKYTAEEFDVAHAQFQASGKPWIYTFFREAALNTATINREDMQSLWAFQDKLNTLGHFWTNYKSTADVKLQFAQQLKLYFDKHAAAPEPTPAAAAAAHTVNNITIIGSNVGDVVAASAIENSFNKK